MPLPAPRFGSAQTRASRARTGAVAALALLAAALPVLPAAAQTSPAAPGPGTINVAAPETGIADPLAGSGPLGRDCRPGQVDVNTAPADRIADVLGVPSDPTVARIVAARPWHRPADLVSVPGIGPARLPDVEALACAEPTELPPPAPLACPPDGRAVDLQAAPARDIANRLGLPRSVAKSLVDARPLPQDLSQIIAPRVPGLPGPRIAEILAAGTVCVTPAPFVHAGRTWRWAYPSLGAVATAAGDSRYALVVPPGRVTAPNGAWATVRPDDTGPGEPASADLHIHGPWTGEVGARLPAASSNAAAAETPAAPAVMHQRDDGTIAFSWGGSVATAAPTPGTAGGTVLAPMTTLSQATSVDLSPLCAPLAGGPVPVDPGSLFCAGDSPRDTDASELARHRGDFIGRSVAAAPQPPPCPDAFSRAVSSGSLTLGLLCGTDVNGSTATWTISNSTAGQTLGGLFTMYGAVIAQTALDPGRHTTGDPVIDGYGPLGQFMAREIVRHSPFVLPQTGTRLNKEKGSGPSRFVHRAATEEQWAAVWSLFNVASAVDGVIATSQLGDSTARSLASAMSNCSIGLLVQKIEKAADILDCVVSVVTLKLEQAAQLAEGNGKPGAAAKIRSTIAVLNKISPYQLGIDAAASYVMQAGATITPRRIVLDHLSDAAPHASRQPGPVGDRTFVARTPQGAGYLVDPDAGTARHIDNRFDFLCYASSRYVRDFVALYQDGGQTRLNLDPDTVVIGQDAPPCPPQTGTWTYSPAPDGNVPADVILRGQEGGPVTSSWLINSSGEIQTILEPGTYVCLAARHPVVWNVPASKIDAWRPVGTASASC